MTHEWLLLAALAAALLATGLFAGTLAGLLGVGGGIVIVPVLYHLFGLIGVPESVKMHVAVGTSLATIVPTSIVSMRAHLRRQAVDTGLLRSWGPAVLIGVLAGTALAGFARGAVLTAVFATVALAVAAHMALTREGTRLSERLPAGPLKWLTGSMIGGFSAMMGIGGGTLAVPTLTLCNYPIRRAVGTATALGLIISIPGTLGFLASGLGRPELPPLTIGYVNLLGLLLIVPATMLTAPFGARMAHAIDVRLLRRLFALFLALTSARMFYGLAA